MSSYLRQRNKTATLIGTVSWARRGVYGRILSIREWIKEQPGICVIRNLSQANF